MYNLATLEDIIQSGRILARKEQDDHTSRIIHRPCTEAELKKTTDDLDILTQWRTEQKELAEQGIHASLLNEAFTNIRTNNANGLRQVSLQIAVYRNDSITPLPPRDGKCWKWIFEEASRTFSLVTSCIRTSSLTVQALDIFGSRPESLGCNLPCDALHRLVARQAVPSTFARLRKLSIGISDLIVIESEFQAQQSGDPVMSGKLPSHLHSQVYDSAPLRAQIAEEANYSSLATMLERCPHLWRSWKSLAIDCCARIQT